MWSLCRGGGLRRSEGGILPGETFASLNMLGLIWDVTGAGPTQRGLGTHTWRVPAEGLSVWPTAQIAPCLPITGASAEAPSSRGTATCMKETGLFGHKLVSWMWRSWL